MNTPAGETFAIEGTYGEPVHSVYQTLPSGPAARPSTLRLTPSLALSHVQLATTPSGVMYPYPLPLSAMNQMLPSGPSTILVGELVVVSPTLN